MKKREEGKRKNWGKKVEKLSTICDGLSLSIWKIFDIPLFSGDKCQVLKIISEKMNLGTKKYWIATVNPEFVMEAEKDGDFRDLLNRTSLNVVDGIGLVWAREFIKLESYKVHKVRNKVLKFLVRLVWGLKTGVDVLKGKYKNQLASGADLILDLAKMAKGKNKKIFLLGGWDNRAEKTGCFLKEKFGLKDNQIGWCPGEPEVSNDKVIRKINEFKPDILLVAYGMKKQEFWVDKNLPSLDVGLVMGVGRSFDYYSGDLERAPVWVRKVGMEWLYSLVKEPKRIKRQKVLPVFIWKVLRDK